MRYIIAWLLTSSLALACVSTSDALDDVGCGGGETHSGGGGVGGETERDTCATADDCTGPNWTCEHRRCVDGLCAKEYAPDGTPDPVDLVRGDCSKLVCNGSGRSVRAFSPDDTGDDGDSCTTESCVDGGGRHIVIASNGDPCVSYIGGSFVVGTCTGGVCSNM